MATSSIPRIKLLHARTPQGYAGLLAKDGQHVFSYAPEAVSQNDANRAISLAMPIRVESYKTTPMLPVFQTFLPEGFLAERIAERFAKTLRMDDMALLAISGANAIGRIRVSQSPDAQADKGPVESLKEILDSSGSRDLFEHLCDRYLIASGIAGVQPKVILEAQDDLAKPGRRGKTSIGEKSSLRGRSLIVKVSGDDFPDLTVNEYHCLSIAQQLGLPVPDFWLSQDLKRLVIERFDYQQETDCFLGFEDMVSLQGKVNARKYEGSYEHIALAIKQNASPAHLQRSLNEFFASLVLSIVLRNGDAHLKNFGLLYTHPASDDCRLSPVYDIVCTTVYLEKDLPALSLAGQRAWPNRATLIQFGRDICRVQNANEEIDRTLAAATEYSPENDETGMWKKMKARIDAVALGLSGA